MEVVDFPGELETPMRDTTMTDNYREALVEAYLLELIPREKILRELGPAQLAEIEAQRNALHSDVKWGLGVA